MWFSNYIISAWSHNHVAVIGFNTQGYKNSSTSWEFQIKLCTWINLCLVDGQRGGDLQIPNGRIKKRWSSYDELLR